MQTTKLPLVTLAVLTAGSSSQRHIVGDTMSNKITATVTYHQNQTFNLDSFDTLDLQTSGGTDTVNIHGIDTVNLTTLGYTTINLNGGTWFGTASATYLAPITINGPGTWVNNGVSSFARLGMETVPVAVLGSGEFRVSAGASISFMSTVGSGQTVHVGPGGTLEIHKPTAFHGLAQIDAQGFTPYQRVDLFGLDNVTSYKVAGDHLDFFVGNRLADQLRYSGPNPQAIGTDSLQGQEA
jgi:hypothetical protein